MNTIAIIMARGGSKGLPRKNVKLLAGKPLIAYTIEHAIASGVCDEVIVTTEDEEIAEIAKKYGAKVPFKRPAELADDVTPPEPVIKHALLEFEKISQKNFDIVVYLQATDLFRSPQMITDCVNRLKDDPSVDTVFSAYKTHKHYWREKDDGNYERLTELTYEARQSRGKKSTYREDQGIASAFRSTLLKEQNRRVGDKVAIITNDDFRSSIDIHNEFDFWLAETVFTQWSGDEKNFNKISEDSLNFLGKDLQSWSQSIRNGYIRSYIIFALHETGVFNLLRKDKNLSVNEIAKKCNLNETILNGVMNFLYHADQIIIKENDKFSLTEKGQQWLFTDPVLAMSFGAVGAYSCILSELVPTLRNEKKYGEDFIRNGEFIAKGSYHTGRANYSWVIEKMKEYGIKKIADLGCGSADVLINFCKINPNLSGVGIDISKEALDEAESRVKKNNLSDRIKLSPGDLYKPETFSESVKDVDAFNSIMVMHEFLRDGEDSVVNMFKSMKKQFKGKYFFLGEFDCLEDKEYQQTKYPDRIHYLFYQHMIHPLTNQGLTTKEGWLNIFKKADIEVVEMNDKLNFRLVQFILKF
jgi:CMP-N,N'-diacetyllegionaminic acid synthase